MLGILAPSRNNFKIYMAYWLTEQQQLVQSGFHDFLAGECTPARVRNAYDNGLTFDEELWKGFGQLGFTGTCIPPDYHGSGLGLMEAALVSEELGRHAAPLFLEGHTLAGLAIALGGSQTQKERLLPGLAAGERIGSVALSSNGNGTAWCDWQVEPGGGNTASVETVPLGDVADVLVIGCANGQLGVLETRQANVRTRNANGIDRSRAIFEVSFDEAAVEALPELPGEALGNALLVLLAADAFGAADRLLELTVEYAKTREQFGQPIAGFQAVKHQLAEYALATVTARGLFWKAAGEFDEEPQSAAKSASMAKAHITDQAMRIARGAVELHGGIGFTWEADVQLYFKRALFDRTFLGTPQMHRERCAQLSGWGQ